MKKAILCALFIGAAFILTACGGDRQISEAPTPSPENTAANIPSNPVEYETKDISAQINAPETLQTVFTSNTGKTRITIDAAVEVPEAEGVSIYEVTSREVPVENIFAFADVVIGEGAWTGDTAYGTPANFNTGGSFDGVTEETLSIVSKETNNLKYPIRHIDAFSHKQHGILRGAQILNFSDIRGLMFNYNDFMLHGRHDTNSQGCAYSREEAIALAEKAANALAPELNESVCGIIPGDYGEEAYLCCFTRKVDGISVTYTIQEVNYLDEDENGDPIWYRILYPYETLRLVVSNEGITSGRYESPYVLSEPMEKNVALLPFDQILRVAKNILPLTLAWLEDAYTIEVSIDRITFGYTRLDFKDDMYRYKLVPAWDFFGTYECYRDGKLIVSHNEDFQSLLTVNAMDGIVIDRRFGF